MFWYTAYIRSDREIDIAQAIRRTDFGGSSVGILPPAEFKGLYHHAAASWNLIALSPPVDGWQALWGSTPKFQAFLFRENRYSGLLLEVTDDKDYNLWSFQVWQDGLCLDWFISDPMPYFDTWEPESIRSVLLPYLARRIPHPPPPAQLEEFLENSVGLFSGDIGLLEQHHLLSPAGLQRLRSLPRRPGNIAGYFSLSASGFTDFLTTLNMPYASLDYIPEEYGLYLDVESGRTDLGKWSDYRETYRKMKTLPDIDKLTCLLLDVKKQDEINIFYY